MQNYALKKPWITRMWHGLPGVARAARCGTGFQPVKNTAKMAVPLKKKTKISEICEGPRLAGTQIRSAVARASSP